MYRLTIAVSVAALMLSACIRPQAPVVLECVTIKKHDRAFTTEAALIDQRYGAAAHTAIPLNAVQYSDHVLSSRVAVQSLHAERTGTQTVRVSARLINCTDAPVALSARAQFLTDGQAPAEPAAAWQRVLLQPRSVGVYQEHSVSREVAHYLIELRSEP